MQRIIVWSIMDFSAITIEKTFRSLVIGSHVPLKNRQAKKKKNQISHQTFPQIPLPTAKNYVLIIVAFDSFGCGATKQSGRFASLLHLSSPSVSTSRRRIAYRISLFLSLWSPVWRCNSALVHFFSKFNGICVATILKCD